MLLQLLPVVNGLNDPIQLGHSPLTSMAISIWWAAPGRGSITPLRFENAAAPCGDQASDPARQVHLR